MDIRHAVAYTLDAMRKDSAALPLQLRAAATDRLRAGLTGLGLVVVVVLLTASNVRSAPPRSAATPGGETLAVIGVAPNSSALATSAAPASAASPAESSATP